MDIIEGLDEEKLIDLETPLMYLSESGGSWFAVHYNFMKMTPILNPSKAIEIENME